MPTPKNACRLFGLAERQVSSGGVLDGTTNEGSPLCDRVEGPERDGARPCSGFDGACHRNETEYQAPTAPRSLTAVLSDAQDQIAPSCMLHSSIEFEPIEAVEGLPKTLLQHKEYTTRRHLSKAMLHIASPDMISPSASPLSSSPNDSIPHLGASLSSAAAISSDPQCTSDCTPPARSPAFPYRGSMPSALDSPVAGLSTDVLSLSPALNNHTLSESPDQLLHNGRCSAEGHVELHQGTSGRTPNSDALALLPGAQTSQVPYRGTTDDERLLLSIDTGTVSSLAASQDHSPDPPCPASGDSTFPAPRCSPPSLQVLSLYTTSLHPSLSNVVHVSSTAFSCLIRHMSLPCVSVQDFFEVRGKGQAQHVAPPIPSQHDRLPHAAAAHEQNRMQKLPTTLEHSEVCMPYSPGHADELACPTQQARKHNWSKWGKASSRQLRQGTGAFSCSSDRPWSPGSLDLEDSSPAFQQSLGEVEMARVQWENIVHRHTNACNPAVRGCTGAALTGRETLETDMAMRGPSTANYTAHRKHPGMLGPCTIDP